MFNECKQKSWRKQSETYHIRKRSHSSRVNKLVCDCANKITIPASINPFLLLLWVYGEPEQTTCSIAPSPVHTMNGKAIHHFNAIADVPGSSKAKLKVNETYIPYLSFVIFIFLITQFMTYLV